jgi:hypothetical protein
MGWTVPGNIRTKADMIAYLKRNSNDGTHTLLASAVVGSSFWYVSEYTNEHGERRRFIGVDVMQTGTREDPDWAYKPMSESCGPVVCDCPLRFLAMAPEANPEWRARVREHHAGRRQRVPIKPGLTFNHEGRRHTVTKRSSTGRTWLIDREDGLAMKASSVLLRRILDRQSAAGSGHG